MTTDRAPHGEPLPRPVSVLRPMPSACVTVAVSETGGAPSGSGLLLDLTALAASLDDGQADEDVPPVQLREAARRTLTQALVLLTSPLLSWTGDGLHIHILTLRGSAKHGQAVALALVHELRTRGYRVDDSLAAYAEPRPDQAAASAAV